MRRLPLIGTARLDAIVRPDGDVEGFFRIPVVIADEHAEAAVGIRVPALVGGRDTGAAVARRIEGQGRLWPLRAGGDDPTSYDGEARARHPGKTSREQLRTPFSLLGNIYSTYGRPATGFPPNREFSNSFGSLAFVL